MDKTYKSWHFKAFNQNYHIYIIETRVSLPLFSLHESLFSKFYSSFDSTLYYPQKCCECSCVNLCKLNSQKNQNKFLHNKFFKNRSSVAGVSQKGGRGGAEPLNTLSIGTKRIFVGQKNKFFPHPVTFLHQL